MSETKLWRHLTVPYCQGAGVDLGSGGDPVVPGAISVDLPPEAFGAYLAVDFQRGPIHLRGDARRLHWFADGVLDFVYSSHLLEDFGADEWPAILREWTRVVRPGGYLVILVPDRERYAAEVAAGQAGNPNHLHEPSPGELTRFVAQLPGWSVLEDRLADERSYTILFVARRDGPGGRLAGS